MTPRVRPATPADLDAIERIECGAFGNPWPRDAYAQELERTHGALEVAEVDDDVAGFSCVWHVADEAHLLRIATDAGHRRSGVAAAMLAQVFHRAYAAGCRHVLLEVAASNLGAIALYRGTGFCVVGRRTGYYRVPADDAILMRRDLVGRL